MSTVRFDAGPASLPISPTTARGPGDGGAFSQELAKISLPGQSAPTGLGAPSNKSTVECCNESAALAASSVATATALGATKKAAKPTTRPATGAAATGGENRPENEGPGPFSPTSAVPNIPSWIPFADCATGVSGCPDTPDSVSPESEPDTQVEDALLMKHTSGKPRRAGGRKPASAPLSPSGSSDTTGGGEPAVPSEAALSPADASQKDVLPQTPGRPVTADAALDRAGASADSQRSHGPVPLDVAAAVTGDAPLVSDLNAGNAAQAPPALTPFQTNGDVETSGDADPSSVSTPELVAVDIPDPSAFLRPDRLGPVPRQLVRAARASAETGPDHAAAVTDPNEAQQGPTAALQSATAQLPGTRGTAKGISSNTYDLLNSVAATAEQTAAAGNANLLTSVTQDLNSNGLATGEGFRGDFPAWDAPAPAAVDPAPSNAAAAPSTETSSGPAAITAAPAGATANATNSSRSGSSSRGHSLSELERVQLVQRVSRAFSRVKEGGTLRLRLSPPELGALQVDVSVKNGALWARMEADTPAARAVLVEQIQSLRDRLVEQGLKIEQLDVTLRDDRSDHAGGFSQSPDDSAQAQSRNRLRQAPPHEHTVAEAARPGLIPPAGTTGLNLFI